MAAAVDLVARGTFGLGAGAIKNMEYRDLLDFLYYSPLTPAALMIGHHFSISALWWAPSPSGVCWSRGGMSWPRSANLPRTVPSANASTTAPLSLATTSLGVALGTHSPCQIET